MRHTLLALTLALAACGSSNGPTDGGADSGSAETGADVLGLDAPATDTQPGEDVHQSEIATDTAPSCTDADGDGYGAGCAMGPDCNDADPNVHPGAMERCDGVDSNCDGVADTDTTRTTLDAYCAGSAPTSPSGAWNNLMPACRYPGDMYSAAAPITAVTCEASYADSRGTVHFVCWHVSGATIPCPMP